MIDNVIDKIFNIIGKLIMGLAFVLFLLIYFLIRYLHYIFVGIIVFFIGLMIYLLYFPHSYERKVTSYSSYSQSGSGLCRNYYDRAIDGSLCGKRAANPSDNINIKKSQENLVKSRKAEILDKDSVLINRVQDTAEILGYDYGLYAETFSNEKCQISANIYVRNDSDNTTLYVYDCFKSEIFVKSVTYYSDDTLKIIDDKSRVHHLKIKRKKAP